MRRNKKLHYSFSSLLKFYYFCIILSTWFIHQTLYFLNNFIPQGLYCQEHKCVEYFNVIYQCNVWIWLDELEMSNANLSKPLYLWLFIFALLSGWIGPSSEDQVWSFGQANTQDPMEESLLSSSGSYFGRALCSGHTKCRSVFIFFFIFLAVLVGL